MDTSVGDELLETIVHEPVTRASASVIWLHGLGADGYDFAGITPELALPDELAVRFVFPHAPYRPVTINQGYVMRAWYDILDSSFTRREDETGIRSSANQVEALIQRELDRGIASSRIVLAGFSQGGAIALHTALRYRQRLAGILALSTYLPLASQLATEQAPINQDITIMMAHGTQDPLVPLLLADQSRQTLLDQQYHVEWHHYDMAHAVCRNEIADISNWLTRLLAVSA